jgi:hypothetical protein
MPTGRMTSTMDLVTTVHVHPYAMDAEKEYHVSTVSPSTREAKEADAPKEAPPTTGFKPATQEGAVAASVNYQVAVYTGDVPGAGTDGDVWVWFDGTLGRSGWRYIDNSDNNFERNQTDYFYLTLPDVGTLTAAWIYFRRSGLYADWYLSTVTINGRTFSYYNWISSNGEYRLT